MDRDEVSDKVRQLMERSTRLAARVTSEQAEQKAKRLQDAHQENLQSPLDALVRSLRRDVADLRRSQELQSLDLALWKQERAAVAGDADAPASTVPMSAFSAAVLRRQDAAAAGGVAASSSSAAAPSGNSRARLNAIRSRVLGLSQDVPDLRLPVPYVASQPLGDCAICLEQMVTGSHVQALQCLHQFHSHCVQSFMASVGKDSARLRCPSCRSSMTPGAGAGAASSTPASAAAPGSAESKQSSSRALAGSATAASARAAEPRTSPPRKPEPPLVAASAVAVDTARTSRMAAAGVSVSAGAGAGAGKGAAAGSAGSVAVVGAGAPARRSLYMSPPEFRTTLIPDELS